MADAAQFQFLCDNLHYEAGTAVAELTKAWANVRERYVDLGEIIQRSQRLIFDERFAELRVAEEIDTAEFERMLRQVRDICVRLGQCLENEFHV